MSGRVWKLQPKKCAFLVFPTVPAAVLTSNLLHRLHHITHFAPILLCSAVGSALCSSGYPLPKAYVRAPHRFSSVRVGKAFHTSWEQKTEERNRKRSIKEREKVRAYGSLRILESHSAKRPTRQPE